MIGTLSEYYGKESCLKMISMTFLMAFLQSLTHLKQAGQQKFEMPSSTKQLVVAYKLKKTCIGRHPLTTGFLMYRILDWQKKSVAG